MDLFDKFVAISENITIIRAVDPGLVHVFHPVECDPNLTETQLEMCKNTRASTYGSQTQLADRFCRQKDKFFSFLNKKKKLRSRWWLLIYYFIILIYVIGMFEGKYVCSCEPLRVSRVSWSVRSGFYTFIKCIKMNIVPLLFV